MTTTLRSWRVRRAVGGIVLGAGALLAPVGHGGATNTPAVPPFMLTLDEARLMALEHNTAFHVERLRPALSRTVEAEARAEFDPAVSATLTRTRVDGADDGATRHEAGVGLEQLLPTGTRLAAGLSAGHGDHPVAPGSAAAYAGGYTLSATQPLLRDRGMAVQRARLTRARYETAISTQVLIGAAQALVAGVEDAVWDYILAGRRIAIFETSLRLAESHRDEVEAGIRIGRLAEIERAAAEAEVAQRREDLINTRAALARRRIALVRLVGPAALGWEREVVIADVPVVPDRPSDPVDAHVAAALAGRPDLEEARLRLARDEMELVRTRNGLLPRLDAFVAFGRTGYADAFTDALARPDDDRSSLEAGIRLTYALGNRRERAAAERGALIRRQAAEALRNMAELVQADVRAAHIEALRTYDQIDATAATRRFREAAYRAETEKLQVGRSTSLLVAQTQRDLTAARIAEVEAAILHLKARTALDRLDATLLQRRGIVLD